MRFSLLDRSKRGPRRFLGYFFYLWSHLEKLPDQIEHCFSADAALVHIADPPQARAGEGYGEPGGVGDRDFPDVPDLQHQRFLPPQDIRSALPVDGACFSRLLLRLSFHFFLFFLQFFFRGLS